MASGAGGMSVLAGSRLHGLHGIHLQLGDPLTGPLLVHHSAFALLAPADEAACLGHDWCLMDGSHSLVGACAGLAPSGTRRRQAPSTTRL